MRIQATRGQVTSIDRLSCFVLKHHTRLIPRALLYIIGKTKQVRDQTGTSSRGGAASDRGLRQNNDRRGRRQVNAGRGRGQVRAGRGVGRGCAPTQPPITRSQTRNTVPGPSTSQPQAIGGFSLEQLLGAIRAELHPPTTQSQGPSTATSGTISNYPVLPPQPG